MPDRALVDYTEAIRLDAAHSRAYCGRGIAYFALGRDEQALADLDKAISLDSSDRQGLQLSRSDARPTGPERASAHRLRHAHSTASGAGRRLQGPGRACWCGCGSSTAQSKILNEAIRLDPKRASAYQNRGAAWNGLGRYDEAVRRPEQSNRARSRQRRRLHEPWSGPLCTRPVRPIAYPT